MNSDSNEKALSIKYLGLVCGGDGGSRTPVRQSSAIGSTCLDNFIVLTYRGPSVREHKAISIGFRAFSTSEESTRSCSASHFTTVYRHPVISVSGI